MELFRQSLTRDNAAMKADTFVRKQTKFHQVRIKSHAVDVNEKSLTNRFYIISIHSSSEEVLLESSKAKVFGFVLVEIKV